MNMNIRTLAYYKRVFYTLNIHLIIVFNSIMLTFNKLIIKISYHLIDSYCMFGQLKLSIFELVFLYKLDLHNKYY